MLALLRATVAPYIPQHQLGAPLFGERRDYQAVGVFQLFLRGQRNTPDYWKRLEARLPILSKQSQRTTCNCYVCRTKTKLSRLSRLYHTCPLRCALTLAPPLSPTLTADKPLATSISVGFTEARAEIEAIVGILRSHIISPTRPQRPPLLPSPLSATRSFCACCFCCCSWFRC